MQYDYLIVGAGFFGSVLAERLANKNNASVLVIDKRNQIGGNCFSKTDTETGIEYHEYGTHIFHTSNETVWKYINQFTKLNNYSHQVLTIHNNKVYQMPLNLNTINNFYNINLKPFEAKEFIENERNKHNFINPENLEEKSISLIGKPLYEAFIKNYTKKQWGRHPADLPESIIARLPVRYNYNNTYFINATFQGIPVDGYTELFKRLLSSKNITIKTGLDFFKHKDSLKPKKKTIFTGSIDKYFEYTLGKLEWRTIKLEKQIIQQPDFQGTSVMNYADDNVKYTRIHEPRHLHPERKYDKNKSIIFTETSSSETTDPHYPIRDKKNCSLFEEYKSLALAQKDLIIGGRLGNFAYIDMDKSIEQALKCFDQHFDNP